MAPRRTRQATLRTARSETQTSLVPVQVLMKEEPLNAVSAPRQTAIAAPWGGSGVMGSPSQLVVTNPKRSGDPSRRSTTNRHPLGPSVRAQLEGNDGGPRRITQKDAPLPLHQLKLRPRADRRLMPGAHPQPSAAPSDGEDAFGPHQEGPLVRARFRSGAAPRRRRVDVGEPPARSKGARCQRRERPTPPRWIGPPPQHPAQRRSRSWRRSRACRHRAAPRGGRHSPLTSPARRRSLSDRISAVAVPASAQPPCSTARAGRVLRPAVRWHRSHLAKSSPLVDRPPDGR
jgi:hypothetical protein